MLPLEAQLRRLGQNSKVLRVEIRTLPKTVTESVTEFRLEKWQLDMRLLIN